MGDFQIYYTDITSHYLYLIYTRLSNIALHFKFNILDMKFNFSYFEFNHRKELNLKCKFF